MPTTGPALSIRGTIHEIHAGGAHAMAANYFIGDADPLIAMAGHGSRIWRDGNRLRAESPDGHIDFITDGTRAWDFTKNPDEPLTGPAQDVHYLGASRDLLRPLTAAETDALTQTDGTVTPVEFAGRRCWSVEFAPPVRIWVDQESRRVLGSQDGQDGVLATLVDLVVGEPVADELFEWLGPASTREQQRQQYRGRIDAIEGFEN